MYVCMTMSMCTLDYTHLAGSLSRVYLFLKKGEEKESFDIGAGGEGGRGGEWCVGGESAFRFWVRVWFGSRKVGIG